MPSLLEEFNQGLTSAPGAKCPYFHSSDAWLAYQAGVFAKGMGISSVATVKKSRGYTVRLFTVGQTWFCFSWDHKRIGDNFTMVRE